MQILKIISPGLKNIKGHSYEYIANVLKAFKSNSNYRCEIFANKDAEISNIQNIAVKKIFEYDPNDQFTKLKIFRPFYKMYKNIFSTKKIMKKIINLKNKEILFFEYIDFYFYSSLISKINAGSKIIIMYRSTMMNYQNTLYKKSIIIINKFLINKLYNIHRNQLIFITDSDLLVNEFEFLFKKKIMNVKIPTSSFQYDTLISYKSSIVKNISYLGRASKEKGWKYLPFILRRYKNNSLFSFHIHCYSNDLQIDLKKFIKEFEKYKNVTLYLNPLSSQDYENFLKKMNITLLFYDLERYKKQTSGITIDCLNYMIYPLTFNDTWISHTLKKYEYGKILNYSNFDDNLINIYKALDDLLIDKLFMRRKSYQNFSKDYSLNSFYNNFENAINNF